MPIAAVPAYLGKDFKVLPCGGAYCPLLDHRLTLKSLREGTLTQ